MTATASPPTVHNRIAHHLPSPLPATPGERQQAWADTLAAAMLVLQRQLASPHPAVAERAALAVFELERTRLRHGRDLAGAAVVPPPRADDLPPLKDPFRVAKSCRRTLEAARAVGEFDAAPEPAATFETMTDAELVDAFVKRKPDEYAKVLAMVQARGDELGEDTRPERVRSVARTFLLTRMAEARATYERRTSPPGGPADFDCTFARPRAS